MKRKGLIIFLLSLVIVVGVILGVFLFNHFFNEQNKEVKTNNQYIYTIKKDDGYYIINEMIDKEEPLFGPAEEIYIEHQDICARVKFSDQTWGIISCFSGEVLIQDCDEILELPVVMVTGAAMRDGKVVIFHLNGDGLEIISEVEGYTSVEQVIKNDFVIVENDGKFGVLYAYNGEVAITADYRFINHVNDPFDEHKTIFSCRKSFVSLPKIQILP